MTRTEQAELHREELASADRLAARIRQQVLQTLGTPTGWHMVQVRPLWDGHYRVNVMIGEGVTNFTIDHSFFLLIDGSGNVIESTPEIVRAYSRWEGAT
jgi:hypothetical protein